MIFFASDTHFGHANIISLCKRPFSTVEEMDETLVANWNAKVSGNDTVYFLGDLFFRASEEKVRDILGRLKGRKHLIVGNHDSTWMTNELVGRFFLDCSNYLDLSDGGRHLVMCHYPQMCWGSEGKSWMIHGHIHNNRHSDYWPLLKARERVLNASVEINDYSPVTFEELVENNARQKKLLWEEKRPCAISITRKHDFVQEAHKLVAKMTLGEKIAQMRYEAPAIERLGIPAYNWWNEALHGVARTGAATVFPQAIAMAASFNSKLLENVAEAISTEVRAKYNQYRTFGETKQYQGITCWSPNINIFRDPRWGRGHETYGEDPFLTAMMGTAFVRGLQQNDKSEYRKTDATLKHFAVHSGPELERHHFNAEVSPKDLWETYLTAFEECIHEAKPAAVMGAYNRVNGEAACASRILLQKCLREQMGFDGYVVSDCGAIADINLHHHLTENEAESAALAVKCGCDLNCGKAYAALVAAVSEGLIDEAAITRSVERLFNARLRLGLLANDCPYDDIGPEVLECKEHLALNRLMARESIVLLKNNGVLPLARSARIAVIGPNANSTSVLKANYNGTPSRYWTILRGLQEVCRGSVVYAEGMRLVSNNDPSDHPVHHALQDALLAARQADVVIMAMGINPYYEGEEGDSISGDKSTIELPQGEYDLLQEVKKAGKPIIWVNVSGSCMNLTEADKQCDAVLQCFYPGASGGLALADVIFGDYNPSGRLPVTFYRSTDDLPDFADYSMKNRTYRYFTGTPLYPFGAGISYSTFKYSNFRISGTEEGGACVEFTLENTGKYDGTEVVQVYIAPAKPRPDDPLKKLVAFSKHYLKAGEKRVIRQAVSPKAFLFVEADGSRVRRGDCMLFEVSGRNAGLLSERTIQ